MNSNIHPASFRDPSGFLFTRNGILYRQVNRSYQEEFELFMSSGLYDALTGKGWLISHEEVDIRAEDKQNAFKILKPEKVETISYPYEWSFSELKDAALCTLAIQKRALNKGLSLKDASAYNIQFRDAKPVLIDSLSFEKYETGKPWVAYRQFCQHFLAPLALMALKDVHLSRMLGLYIDGVPLDLASRLLPWKSRLNFGLNTHIHLHAAFQQKHSADGEAASSQAGSMSQQALEGLITSLETFRHGMGGLLPADFRPLLAGCLRSQDGDHRILPGGNPPCFRLGPGRQHRPFQPGSQPEGHSDRGIRYRSGSRGTELPGLQTGAGKEHAAAGDGPDQPQPVHRLEQP